MPARIYTIVAILTLAVPPLYADENPRAPLDELLATPISTAARYEQQLASVAASVTVITAEEIERYGWTSLDEAIESVRDMFVTNDRNYSYFGIRGIGRPTDYNVRVLILLDGHPMNGGIWGEGATSGAMALDLGMVEKIEIVRGPGSALYGGHAMLAVINIISKDASSLDGFSFSASAGSHGKQELSLRSGFEMANGARFTAAARWSDVAGADLYQPEFDNPGVSDGVARGLDYERLYTAAAGFEKGGLRIDLSTRSRLKGIPNASFETAFNGDSNSLDRRDLAVVDYSHLLGRGKTLEAGAYVEKTLVRAQWQYDTQGVTTSRDTRVGAEVRLHWDIRPNQRLTVGSNVVDHPQASYSYVIGDYDFELRRAFTESSYYVQHEYHPTPRLGFMTGLRHDRFSHAPSSTNPRAAVLFTPNRNTTLKLLYGTAFLEPNLYQTFFQDPETPWKTNPDLRPESTRTLELAWEQRLGAEVLLVGSAYRIKASSLIETALDPNDSVYWYKNLGDFESRGAGVGLDWRRSNGIWTYLNYSLQEAATGGEDLVNAPDQQLKAGISTSPWKKLHGGLEVSYESPRHTRSGSETEGSILVNGVVSRQIAAHLRASLAVRNLFNADYAVPAGVEFRQQTIPQDGRTLTFKLTYTR
jgi:iron complex outermembrane receptor protein